MSAVFSRPFADGLSGVQRIADMGLPKRTTSIVTEETAEIAQHAAAAAAPHRSGGASFGGAMTGLASAVALVFSAISLYHSVLKQPELEAHMSQVVHYTRDTGGAEEVFAIPLTIANHGARDGTVLDLELKVTPAQGGESKVFYSAFMVDGDYFVPPGRFDPQARRFERVDRPKQPFAPIAVPGRDSYSGTLLFYRKGKAFPKVVSAKGDYRLELALNTRLDQSLGAVDALLAKELVPIELVVRLPYFSESKVRQGGTHSLKSVAWSINEPQTPSSEPQDQKQ
jgi:hypothetical protein